MRTMAIKLADPFGTDDTDFDIDAMMNGVYKETIKQLVAPRHVAVPNSLPDGHEEGKPIANPLIVSNTAETLVHIEAEPVSGPPSAVHVQHVSPSWIEVV